MSHRALLAAAGAQAKLYSEDVFSAFTYTGNGSTQTITNGIDLTKGGMVWIKSRSLAGSNHTLFDTLRGVNNALISNSTAGTQALTNTLTSFNSAGFSLGADPSGNDNSAGASQVAWTFARASKFFDAVTWTGDGTSNRQIPHALGIAPGMVTAKRRDAAGDWAVWHRSATGDLYLDTNAAQTGSFTQITAASATTFSVSGNANILNATYVAYAWAHDPDTVNGIVQCGSYTTDASAKASVTLGWEPQYIMLKVVSGGVSDWLIHDSARGLNCSGGYAILRADTSAAELANTTNGVSPTATGFVDGGNIAGGVSTIAYLAIRRGPMRTPTTGTSVYNAIARTGTGGAATVTGVGFAPDTLLSGSRASPANFATWDRLRGPAITLITRIAGTEYSASDGVVGFDVMDGFRVGADAGNATVNYSGSPLIQYNFRRAPGFFDIVCYKGTGAVQTVAHNLGVAPGMMWIKDRTTANDWAVYHSALGALKFPYLNLNGVPGQGTGMWNNTAPTATNFTVSIGSSVGTNGDNYVAYLFGEVPGVSKIGSYTGNGATQTINCGFASGARFVLIKRTDSTGDWAVFDTVRGIIAGNDPLLYLDLTNAETTLTDFLTPQSVGFGLNNTALNSAGGTYIYLAIA